MAEGREGSQKVLVKRKKEREIIEKMKGFYFEYLIQTDKFEMLKVRVSPGAETEALSHNGEESHVVLQGELDIMIENTTHHLKEGDSIWYLSTNPHKWKNPGNVEAVVHSIAFPRTYASLLFDKLRS